MKKITLEIDGMMCSMCESHVNDCIRRNFNVKKVSSSHSKGKTEIITEDDISENQLRDVISQTGYSVLSVAEEPYQKKSLFSAFHKN